MQVERERETKKGKVREGSLKWPDKSTTSYDLLHFKS